MTRRIVLVVLSALFCSFLTSTARAATLPRPAARLLRAVNTARIAHGDRPLRLDWTLTAAARAHSSDMLAHDYFAHRDFGGRKTGIPLRPLVIGGNPRCGNR